MQTTPTLGPKEEEGATAATNTKTGVEGDVHCYWTTAKNGRGSRHCFQHRCNAASCLSFVDNNAPTPKVDSTTTQPLGDASPLDSTIPDDSLGRLSSPLSFSFTPSVTFGQHSAHNSLGGRRDWAKRNLH